MYELTKFPQHLYALFALRIVNYCWQSLSSLTFTMQSEIHILIHPDYSSPFSDPN